MQCRLVRISIVMACGLTLALFLGFLNSCGKPGGQQARVAKNDAGNWTTGGQQAQVAKNDAGNWISFTDPNEHAFSFDVPAGWKTEGGLVRRGAVDTSLFLRALSPDGAILLIIGDPAPAAFGTLGLDASPKARPYLPGEAFARQYVEQSLPPVCSGLTFLTGADRPDIANGPLAQFTPYARHDAGDVLFSCSHHGGPTRAYMVADTYLYPSPIPRLSGKWGLSLLAGCLAPADRLEAAKKMVLHMVQSLKLDPEWLQKQGALTKAAIAGINEASAAQQRFCAASLARGKAQQAAMRQEYNDFQDVQTQTGTFRDAEGHVYTNVQNTKPYHWSNPGGQTTETSSPTPPPGTGWTLDEQTPTR